MVKLHNTLLCVKSGYRQLDQNCSLTSIKSTNPQLSERLGLELKIGPIKTQHNSNTLGASMNLSNISDTNTITVTVPITDIIVIIIKICTWQQLPLQKTNEAV